MRATTPVDAWSAYYSLLTEALSKTTMSSADAAALRASGYPKRLSWFDRVDRYFAKQREEARERYLAQSSDLADLERRMREIDRFHYY
jgi:Protein of unknown function (DUF3563)